MKHAKEETEEEFDARYVAYLSRPDIDGWELRKAMNELQVCVYNIMFNMSHNTHKKLINKLIN